MRFDERILCATRCEFPARPRWISARKGAAVGRARCRDRCSAVGAFGGVGINLALRESYLRSGTETSAHWLFLASYLVSAILTWRMYVRRPLSAATMPGPQSSPALARV